MVEEKRRTKTAKKKEGIQVTSFPARIGEAGKEGRETAPRKKLFWKKE